MAVEPARDEAPPDGARALDALAIGALVVRLVQRPEVLEAVTRTVRAWLGRGSGRRVRLELDGDVIELTDATDEAQLRLVDAWIARHGIS